MGGSGGTGGTKSTGGSGGGGSAGGTGGSGGGGGAGGSGGGGGAGGTGGSSTTPDAAPPPSRGPTPHTTTTSFPFPQNRENTSNCIFPTLYDNNKVYVAYEQWRKDTVTSTGLPKGCPSGCLRVQRPSEPSLEQYSTVSEGIGYGMLIAVYMNDQALFDGLWLYEQQFLDSRYGLMNWYIKADGSGPGDNPSGVGPATDADEDMAYALIMADKQWGGKGKLNKNYIDFAKAQMSAVWNNEIYNYIYLRAGPWADDSNLNLSYFAPSYYKVFATIDQTPTSNWTKVIDTMYTVLNASLSNGNATNGLVPAWCDRSGKPNGQAYGSTGGASPTNYQYDSCRTPFRVGLDWCLNGDKRAQTYVALTSKFFSTTVGGATQIVDGYDLNGTPHAQYQTGANAQKQSAAFVGPAGVGAMSDKNYQTFVNDAYGVLATPYGNPLYPTVGGTYYDDSWMVLSLLMMTANFLDFTSITPN